MDEKKIQEIEKILTWVPPSPWCFSPGNDFDHWELWSDDMLHGYHMVHDDSGVPPDAGFIQYVLKSRSIIEDLLKEVKKYKEQDKK